MQAMARGLLVNAPRPDSLRFMPSLTVSDDEIDRMIDILDGVLGQDPTTVKCELNADLSLREWSHGGIRWSEPMMERAVDAMVAVEVPHVSQCWEFGILSGLASRQE